MPSGPAAKWWVWLLAVLVIIAILVWRPWERGTVPPTGATVPDDCPQHLIAIDTNGAAPGPIVDDIPIASESDEIPEFHDCQRFAATGNAYGPLIAIWSATNLGSAFRMDTNAEKVKREAGVASPRDTTSTSDPLNTPWVPVAEIYNYDPAEYKPLSILPGFSCLYLREVPPSPAAPDGWKALIVPLHNELGCLEERSARDSSLLHGADLLVKATSPAAPDHIPPVARWDREPGPRSARQYIGIRCRDQWCEVGPRDGFASSATAEADPPLRAAYLAAFEQSPVRSVAGDEMMRVITVKGWYDEQVLSELTGTPATLTQSQVTGTIIPHPTLDGILDPGQFGGQWLPAAYIYATGAYDGKVRLEAGMNKVYLCRDSPAARCPTSGRLPGAAAATTAAGEWFAIFDGPAPDKADTVRFHYDGTPGVIPAGAARWRWMETDEGAWVRCAGGCCSSN
jgi:hypothetical protein